MVPPCMSAGDDQLLLLGAAGGVGDYCRDVQCPLDPAGTVPLSSRLLGCKLK